jgi:O-antigen/teichoic acid export membrane protein
MIRKIATSTSLQIVALAISVVDRIVLGALMLRLWGVAVFEDWSILLAAAGLMTLLDFGLHMTFSNAYTSAYQKGQLALLQRYISIALFICLLIVGAGAVFLIAAAVSFSYWTGLLALSRLGGFDGGLVFICFGLAALLQTSAAATSTIYRAQGHFSRALVIDICYNSTRLLAIAIAIIAGGEPQLVAGIYLAVAALFTVVIVPLDLQTNLGGFRLIPASPTRAEIRNILTIAPWFYAQQATNVLLVNVPLLVLPHLSPVAGAIALFLLLRTVVNMVRQLSGSVSISVGIELSQMFLSTSDKVLVQQHVLRLTRLNTVSNSACAGALFWLMEPFVPLWSGGALQLDPVLAIIFGCGFLLSIPFSIVASFLNYIGDAQIGAISRLVTAVISIGVAIALAKPLGVHGVAAGLAVGETIGMGMMYLNAASNWMGVTHGSSECCCYIVVPAFCPLSWQGYCCQASAKAAQVYRLWCGLRFWRLSYLRRSSFLVFQEWTVCRSGGPLGRPRRELSLDEGTTDARAAENHGGPPLPRYKGDDI